VLKYQFDPIAFCTALLSSGLLSYFALGGPRWSIIGGIVAAIAAVVKNSFHLSQQAADSPAKSLIVQAAGDSVPIFNGHGHAVGQVETTPVGQVTTPASTATPQ
jgi:hypothetical protein